MEQKSNATRIRYFLLGAGMYLLQVGFMLFSVGGGAQEPQCTTPVTPENGATGVAVTTLIQWAPVANATRYFLAMGDMPGGTSLADNLDLGNETFFRPPSGLEPNTTYYYRVIPSNNEGDALGCAEVAFTTGAGGGAPGCVTLQYPEHGSYGVPPDSAIRWFPQAGAAGYYLAVGTAAGTTDLFPETDIGNVTSFTLPQPMPALQQIYVSITPYSQDGQVPDCSLLSFRTRGMNAPLCTEIIDPRDGAEFVSVTANITWIRDFNASGYRMTIEEKTIGGVRILDNEDVGNGTNFKPPNFLPNTRYFITITPYNDLGFPNCDPISFTTGDAPDPPLCTRLLQPPDGATNVEVTTGLSWSPMNGARGYYLEVGTSPGGRDLLNREDVGNETAYSFPEALPDDARIYVRIIPYNAWGEAGNCPQESFRTQAKVRTTEVVPVPPFFTPNGDGYNDSWLVQSTQEVPIDNVRIFTRFGALLKQLGPGQAWDGNYNGKPMASDSYWYSLETANGTRLTGYLLLKR